jgi:hypothetical protein
MFWISSIGGTRPPEIRPLDGSFRKGHLVGESLYKWITIEEECPVIDNPFCKTDLGQNGKRLLCIRSPQSISTFRNCRTPDSSTLAIHTNVALLPHGAKGIPADDKR